MAKIKYYSPRKKTKSSIIKSIVGDEYQKQYKNRLEIQRKLSIQNNETLVKARDVILLSSTNPEKTNNKVKILKK